MTAGALLFDFDGTLAQTGPEASVRLTCQDIAAACHGLVESELLLANGDAWREYWPGVEDAWTLGRIDGRTVGIEAWRRTLERCECYDQKLAAWAQERHWFHTSQTISLFEDVEPFFNAIEDRVPLVLLTNGASDTQRHALQSLGIEGLFSVVFISGERGLAKPAPEVFLTVLQELGVPPKDAWHVGDNLMTDIAGAKAAGVNAVWLNRRGEPVSSGSVLPDHEIRSLVELPALL